MVIIIGIIIAASIMFSTIAIANIGTFRSHFATLTSIRGTEQLGTIPVQQPIEILCINVQLYLDRNHQQADTKWLLHAVDGTNSGATTVKIM